VSASRTQADQTGRADDQQAARQTLERMRKDVHCASGATVQPILDGSGNPTGGYLLNLTETANYCPGVTTLSSGVQWCTAHITGSSLLYGLYRTNTGSCSSSGALFQITTLTSGNLWSLLTCSTGQLPRVSIDMPVNRDIATRPTRTYELTDAIALRNANACT
jgi:hypothetical protein